MPFAVERALRQESQVPEAVVDRNDNDALLDERSGVVVGAGASGQASAMNPEHHRRPAIFLTGVLLNRHVDVQKEAVLSADASRLSALAAERRRVEYALPAAERLRRHPAQVADGSSGVRDAKELGDVAVDHAPKLAAGTHDNGSPGYFMDFLGVGGDGA